MLGAGTDVDEHPAAVAEGMRIDLVEHDVAVAPRLHKPHVAQGLEMLGDGRGCEMERLDDGLDRKWPLRLQKHEDVHPIRDAQRSKRLRRTDLIYPSPSSDWAST